MLFLCLPLLIAAKASAPLELPPVIHLAQATAPAKVGKALAEACTNQEWIVEGDRDGALTARLDRRDRVLRIRIEYTERDVSFRYLASENLGALEDSGAVYIHPNANKHLRRLESEVRIQLQRLNLEQPRTEVVPVDPQP